MPPPMMRSASGESVHSHRGADTASIACSTRTDTSGFTSLRRRYVRVKTRHKSTKDFGHLYLAQELTLDISPPAPVSPSRSSSDPAVQQANGPTTARPRNSTTTSSSSTSRVSKRRPATWTMEFSPDGRYLAAAGQDGVVRVWQVLGSADERRQALAGARGLMHRSSTQNIAELAGTSPTSTPSRKRANTGAVPGSPVFSPKPILELIGHTADVLDLSWSKVCPCHRCSG